MHKPRGWCWRERTAVYNHMARQRLPCGAGRSARGSVVGTESARVDARVCTTDALCRIVETNTTL